MYVAILIVKLIAKIIIYNNKIFANAQMYYVYAR